MLDYLFCAPDQNAAIADATLGAFRIEGQWRGDCVIAGVQVWLYSGDVSVGTDPVTGLPIVAHTYLPGFWLIISQNVRSAALEASPYLVFGADRDSAIAGNPPGVFIFILGPGQSPANFVGAHVSPTFAGSNYPFGSAA